MTTYDFGNLVKAIEDDGEIQSLLIGTPEVATIPFQRSGSEMFLGLAAIMRREKVTLSNISRLIQGLIGHALSQGFCMEMKAIELLLYAKDGQAYEPLLRFSIEDSVFKCAPKLSGHDLLNRVPSKGILCAWYADPANVAFG